MKAYRQLEKRIAREKQLLVAQQKMEIKRKIQVISLDLLCITSVVLEYLFWFFFAQNKKDPKPVRISPGTKFTAPVYKWKTERKR